ncbi:MAG TPA: DnaJ domain-containing protein [Kofleriaceae bacterium]|nr:DnaJ domain-containing protein [Kofleriaceae bacterium]
MSTVPAEIGGIGSTQLKLRQTPGFSAFKDPTEYFLWSRVDGVQTVREVMLASGLPVEQAVTMLQRLRAIGALLLPGEILAPAAGTLPMPIVATRRPAPAELDVSLPDPSADELKALAEANALDSATRRRILAMSRLVAQRDPWALLGVPQGSNYQALKRAYFKLSKAIHPDRYYGRNLGSFAERLSTVFEATSRAYERLTSADSNKSGAHKLPTRAEDQPQSPQEYAGELFERAIAVEVGGGPLEAMKLFAAAIRLDPQTRFLRRAANCALAAGQPRTALEYAKKAQAASPSDPSLARLLAIAFKAAGKLADAEEVLVMAMALKSENDALGTELRSELAEVRRLLNS